MSKNLRATALGWLLCWFAFADNAHGSRTVVPPGLPYIVEIWTVPDGLPQSSVFSITQTRDGYLWLGTLNGLVRFDGLKFTVFNESDTPGLNSSRVMQTFEDSEGNLWVATENAGAARINSNGRVTSIAYPPDTAGGRVLSICESPAGTLWMLFENGILGRVENGQIQLVLSGCKRVSAEKSGVLLLGMDSIGRKGVFAPAQTVTNTTVFFEVATVSQQLDALVSRREGGFWLLADGSIQEWKQGAPTRTLASYPWSTNTFVSAVCEDELGNPIVGTLGEGVYWFDANGQFVHLSDKELSHTSILSLTIDGEGNLWIGTNGGGLNRVRHRKFGVFSGSEERVVQSASEDAKTNLWVGYNGESRVDRSHDGKTEVLALTKDAAIAPNCFVKSVFADNQGQVWAGAWYGGPLEKLWKWNEQSNRFNPAPPSESIRTDISVLYQDRAGRFWAGTQDGLALKTNQGWVFFGVKDGLPGPEVRGLSEDKDGNLWIATSGGLAQRHEGKFTSFRKENGLPSNDLSSVYVDRDGVVWVGTRGSGMLRAHGTNWTHYTTRDGLAGNSIAYLIEDDVGYLWIGSNAGLMRVPKKSMSDFAAGAEKSVTCRTYVEADGLPTRECTQGSQPAACRRSDGTFCFPTAKGLVSVNPAALRPSRYQAPMMIESVLVAGQEQNTNRLRAELPRVIEIPPGKDQLEIYYTSLNLGAAGQARFRYRLEEQSRTRSHSEDHETEWNYVGNTRMVHYSKLPPDRYRFEVTAANEDGVWNPEPAVQWIVVQPPFWRTAWFLALMSIGLLAIIVIAVHRLSTQKLQRQLARLRQEEELEKERSRIARDLHDQLGANLMQVAMLGDMAGSDKDQPAEVEEHARQISQTARETTKALDEIVWAVNPSNDTLDGLITYICKYAQEYFEMAGIRYRIDVPTELPKTPIPPEVRHNIFLAAKEAVNNVVKHAQASEAWLRLHIEPGRFTLEMEDNGRGLAGMDQKTGRNGLRNMRKRLEDVGGSFSISPAPNQGAIVRLSAPVKHQL